MLLMDPSVLTGTGISVPDAMIAFLLLVVKTVGREIVLKRPVLSSRCTTAAREFPAARKTLAPASPLVASCVKLSKLDGSKMLPPVNVGRSEERRVGKE